MNTKRVAEMVIPITMPTLGGAEVVESSLMVVVGTVVDSVVVVMVVVGEAVVLVIESGSVVISDAISYFLSQKKNPPEHKVMEKYIHNHTR